MQYPPNEVLNLCILNYTVIFSSPRSLDGSARRREREREREGKERSGGDKEWQTRSQILWLIWTGGAKAADCIQKHFELNTIGVTSIKCRKGKVRNGIEGDCLSSIVHWGSFIPVIGKHSFTAPQFTGTHAELCNPVRHKTPQQPVSSRNRFLYSRLRGGLHAPSMLDY